MSPGSRDWRGSPWGPVDDPGELASMAADEAYETALEALHASEAQPTLRESIGREAGDAPPCESS